jgi:outer membrane protein assembly factor BamB
MCATPISAVVSIPSTAVRVRPFRWWWGALILLIGASAQTFFGIRYAEDPTFAKMSVLWVWPATLFALTVWWVFGSGLTWRIKLVPFLVGVVGFVAFFSVYRIDGSDGDMVPRFVYRWTPLAEDQAREYWRTQPKTVTVTAPAPVEAVPADVSAAPPATAALPEPSAEDWYDFRGPQRDGVIRGGGFRTDWETRPPRELWRHPVGLGWSSFAVLGDHAITMEQRDELESVVCYRLETGEPIWIHGDQTRFTAVAVNGGDGPHGTPVIAGPQTYSLGGTGILNCLETATGNRLWSRNILADAGDGMTPAANLEWGVSGSPCVHADYVLVIAGGTTGKSVLAYDRLTGDIRWSGGSFPASYGGPRVETFHGTPVVLAYHGLGLAGFALETGALLWDFPWENMPKVNAAQPIKLDDESLVIGTGYGLGATRLILTAGNPAWSVESVWKTNRFKLKFNDAVLVDGHLYGLDDGILTCVDPTSGKTKWKARRVGYGQLLAFQQTLLILSEEGELILAAANPKKFEELGQLKVLEGTTWNHPAFAHGRLLVRNGSMAACYDLAP